MAISSNRLFHLQFKKEVYFMKRKWLFPIFVIFIMASTAAYASERAPLGETGHIGLKVDYISFTDMSNVTSGLAGLFLYFDVTKNLYLGGEFGYAFGDMNDVKFIPLELNIKYAVETSPHVVIDFGAGGSVNYAEYRSTDDWLLGGQFFAGLNYASDAIIIGLHGKYQITEDFGRSDFNNWRAGLQIGFPF